MWWKVRYSIELVFLLQERGQIDEVSTELGA